MWALYGVGLKKRKQTGRAEKNGEIQPQEGHKGSASDISQR